MRRFVLASTLVVAVVAASAANARVLLVGTYHGKRGPFHTIQAAINAAHAGDWVLIGPGDYKTHIVRRPPVIPIPPPACSSPSRICASGG